MKKNMGSADRVIRILLGVLFIALYALKTVQGTWGIVLGVVGGVFLLTSFASFCPLYTIVGLHTTKVKKAQG